MIKGDIETTITYEEQALVPVSKRKKEWDCCMEWPADTFSSEKVIEETRNQRPLAEKPLRVVKVTVIKEVIEVFD